MRYKEGDYLKCINSCQCGCVRSGSVYLIHESRVGYIRLTDDTLRNQDWSCYEICMYFVPYNINIVKINKEEDFYKWLSSDRVIEI